MKLNLGEVIGSGDEPMPEQKVPFPYKSIKISEKGVKYIKNLDPAFNPRVGDIIRIYFKPLKVQDTYTNKVRAFFIYKDFGNNNYEFLAEKTGKDINKSTHLDNYAKKMFPQFSFATKTLSVISKLTIHIIEKISKKTVELVQIRKGTKILVRDIENSIKLTFPTTLAAYTINASRKSLEEFKTMYKEKKDKNYKGTIPNMIGLSYSVSKIKLWFKISTGDCYNLGYIPGIYFTAALEYVIKEVINGAIESATDKKNVVHRISPPDLHKSIRSNKDLTQLYKGVVLTGGI